jgi:signal transduction histidine kinase
MGAVKRTFVISTLVGLTALVAVAEAHAQSSAAASRDRNKRVLVLFTARRDAPYTIAVENVFRQTLANALSDRIDYYTEYIDLSRFSGEDYQIAIRDFLKRKYANVQPDVVVSDGVASFDFLAEHRTDLFPGVPIVFNADESRFRPMANATGVVFSYELGRTLGIALQLHPQVTRVFVITGASEYDRFFEQLARKQFREYERQTAIDYVPPMPFDQLRRFVSTAPAGSIIYFASFYDDGAGHKLIPQDVLASLAHVASVPMYCWPEMTLGLGIVGGDLMSEEGIARETAAVAVRVLEGEAPASIPKIAITPYIRAFDSRQLSRWRISEERLPPGSVVRFKDVSFWALYRWRILLAVSVFLGQALLIIGLIVNRVRRSQAESALRISHDRSEHLARRLLVAQEEERKHIARELHDDACQDVAAVAVNVNRLLQRQDVVEPSVRMTLSSVHARIVQTAETLRLLSHNLHPSVLQHMGLIAALEAHCVEAERQHDIQVNFIVEGDVEPALPTVALSLFRIAQEALRNAARHGQARHATVALIRRDDHLMLSVTDDGTGFDVADAAHRDGLGLVSMEERARLINGRLTIHSELQRGTTVEVRVPVSDAGGAGNRTPARELSTTDSLTADVDRDVGDRQVI